jgi:hypothetical protein
MVNLDNVEGSRRVARVQQTLSCIPAALSEEPVSIGVAVE